MHSTASSVGLTFVNVQLPRCRVHEAVGKHFKSGKTQFKSYLKYINIHLFCKHHQALKMRSTIAIVLATCLVIAAIAPATAQTAGKMHP